MMTVQGLRDTMKTATQGKTDAASALTALGNAIADYIKDNAELAFQWTGTNTAPPYNAENQTPAGEIIALSIILTVSGATSKDPALTALGNEITAGIKLGTYNITESGYLTTPAVMADAPQFAISIAQTGDRDAAYEDMADDIISTLTGYVPVAPCAGTHGAYAGSGIVTGIS